MKKKPTDHYKKKINDITAAFIVMAIIIIVATAFKIFMIYLQTPSK